MDIEDSIMWYVSTPITNDKDELDRDFQVGDLVRHWKDGLYEVIAFGISADGLQPTIIYKSLHTGRIWTRLYKSFTEPIDIEKFPEAIQPYKMVKVALFIDDPEDYEDEDFDDEEEEEEDE